MYLRLGLGKNEERYLVKICYFVLMCMELYSIILFIVFFDYDNFDFIVVLLYRYWKYYGDIFEEGFGDIC